METGRHRLAEEGGGQDRAQVGVDRPAFGERGAVPGEGPGDPQAARCRGLQVQRAEEVGACPERFECGGRLAGQPEVVVLAGLAHPNGGGGVDFQAGPLGADGGQHGAVDELALMIVGRPEFQGPGGLHPRPRPLIVGVHDQPHAGEAELQGIAARGGLPLGGPGAGRPHRIAAVRVDARLRGGHLWGIPGVVSREGSPATSPERSASNAQAPFEDHRSEARFSPWFPGNFRKWWGEPGPRGAGFEAAMASIEANFPEKSTIPGIPTRRPSKWQHPRR
ncbi:hypothetical protein EP7_002063 [Isosphaeraceae bacterium EP7]